MANLVLNLKTPIKTHSGELSRVEFREPNAEDILSIGSPSNTIVFRGQDKYQIEMNKDAVRSYLGRLSSQGGMDVMGGLKGKDFLKFYEWLFSLFNDGEPEEADATKNS